MGWCQLKSFTRLQLTWTSQRVSWPTTFWEKGAAMVVDNLEIFRIMLGDIQRGKKLRARICMVPLWVAAFLSSIRRCLKLWITIQFLVTMGRLKTTLRCKGQWLINRLVPIIIRGNPDFKMPSPAPQLIISIFNREAPIWIMHQEEEVAQILKLEHHVWTPILAKTLMPPRWSTIFSKVRMNGRTSKISSSWHSRLFVTLWNPKVMRSESLNLKWEPKHPQSKWQPTSSPKLMSMISHAL